MRQLLAIILLLPILVNAQKSSTEKEYETSKSAIHWTKGLTWKEILAKAKAEKKYIFVDCIATWCVPCKKMDSEVYVNDSVGAVINSNFIAVKVQIDTSKNDDEYTQKWYGDAHNIAKQYKVSFAPTYLFFSSDGEILTKAGGYANAQTFISFVKDALNPKKQYSTLLKSYNKGEIDFRDLPYLTTLAEYFEDYPIAKRAAKDYINDYLLNLSDKDLYTVDNISFITTYVGGSKAKAFQLVYNNTKRVNKVIGKPGFAESWIHYIITMEEIEPEINATKKTKGKDPDWGNLRDTITKKYNRYYADRTIMEAKTRWYAYLKKWPEVTKYTVEFVEKYGLNMEDFTLAVKAWTVFLYSRQNKELNAALKWSKGIIERSKDSINVLPAVMDTYANLAYKISYLFGNNKSSAEAISIEEKALAMATKNHIEQNIKAFRETIENMKAGKVTWKL